ncbi:aspartate kinase [Paenibacillus sp. GCM10027626]|uniref:aspartate kinase n=1 Tax=Paenibacillus sp. GCM10027626 TaxID=3273411 RepID=UPI00363223C8
MPILVQKYGGTSLSSEQTRGFVLRHIARERQRSYQLVVVVSAMGRRGDPYATDTLLALVHNKGGTIPQRERDLLLGCGEIISAVTLCSLLRAEGIPSVVLTGGGAGILTDSQFGRARILTVKTDKVLQLLQQNQVVIVTGFQGIDEKGDLTTLGRGGSDTSATALAAALRAERVDIYTDVNGILTADPRIVEDARPIPVVGYAEICNMARQGAKVIHPRAVEIAQQSHIPIRVRSTFSEEEGTLVTDQADVLAAASGSSVKDRQVTGVTHVSGVTQITVTAHKGDNDVQLNVFHAMAKHQISVDFINVTPGGATYTVFDEDADAAVEVLQSIGYEPFVVKGCAKVSIIGGGMNGVPGIMASIVEALTKRGIPILQSADSNTTIWVLVREENMVEAQRSLHAQFNLHE